MSSSPWVSFYLTAQPGRTLSFLTEVSCSYLGALEAPGYCRKRGGNLHLLDQDGYLDLRQIQAPLLGLPTEAAALEEGEDQKRTGNEEVMEDRRGIV